MQTAPGKEGVRHKGVPGPSAINENSGVELSRAVDVSNEFEKLRNGQTMRRRVGSHVPI